MAHNRLPWKSFKGQIVEIKMHTGEASLSLPGHLEDQQEVIVCGRVRYL